MNIYARLTIAAAALIAGPALADEQVAEGEKVVAKRCKACHAISNGDQEILKGGGVGPNLWGIVGRKAGSYPDFKYGDDLVAAGEAGLVWDKESLDSYLDDPKEFLKTYLNKSDARSKMSFKLNKEEDRAAAAAYLASLPK